MYEYSLYEYIIGNVVTHAGSVADLRSLLFAGTIMEAAPFALSLFACNALVSSLPFGLLIVVVVFWCM